MPVSRGRFEKLEYERLLQGFKWKIEIWMLASCADTRERSLCHGSVGANRIIQASRYTYCQCITRYARIDFQYLACETVAKGKPVRTGIMNLNILVAIVRTLYSLYIRNC